ncbi:MAG: sigma-70 family RNA polymerase sigma factor [Verrucomicrobia bacterium]|nr:sigma-70 family RNA polymerase sigma factor [Verrucomicrobiota bacterium]
MAKIRYSNKRLAGSAARVADKQMETASDEALAQEAQSGSLDAYDEIVRRYQERIWSFLFKFCPHQSELEDLAQDTFIKAYQNLHQWKPNGTFKSWLMRLAVNTGYDYYRKRRNEPLTIAQKTAKDTEADPLEILTHQVEETKEEHPASEMVELILLKLNPEDRLVITLQYFDRKSLRNSTGAYPKPKSDPTVLARNWNRH